MTLALFDLDNTLLNGDSDYSWGQFLVDQGTVDADTYARKNAQFYSDYVSGTLDIHEYSRFAFQVLVDTPRAALESLREEFIKTIIKPMMMPRGQEVLNDHRKKGDIVIIITATNSFITQPIAEEYGVEHLIATEPAIQQGQYTTEIEGIPCYREGKVTRLNEWLQSRDLDLKHSYFYSDSHNDVPLLELVTNPVAIDPDDELRQFATEKGWEITSFR